MSQSDRSPNMQAIRSVYQFTNQVLEQLELEDSELKDIRVYFLTDKCTFEHHEFGNKAYDFCYINPVMILYERKGSNTQERLYIDGFIRFKCNSIGKQVSKAVAVNFITITLPHKVSIKFEDDNGFCYYPYKVSALTAQKLTNALLTKYANSPVAEPKKQDDEEVPEEEIVKLV